MKRTISFAFIALMLCIPLTMQASDTTMPEVSTEDNAVYYRMYTPLRENRYPTSKGIGVEIAGEKVPTNSSIWKFVQRADGSLDIVNATDGSYISPESTHNTALKTSAASPSTGWSLAPAATAGLFIIKSGSAQFNQTNDAQLDYKVYNWGGGNNTDDAGCQYVFEKVEYTSSDITEGNTENSFYIAAHTKQSDGSYTDRYLYANGSTLSNNTTYAPNDVNYEWELVPNGDNVYYIKNGSGKYLSYANKSLTLSDAATYSFQFKDDAIDKVSGAKSLYNTANYSGGKYMVMAANGSGYNQNSTPVNNGSWCSDYILTPCSINEDKPSLTITSNTRLANAIFIWNGHDITSSSLVIEEDEAVTNPTLALKAHNEAYSFEGFYSDAAYTTPITEITSLTESMTVYAKFALNPFSTNYGDKLIRIKMFRDANYSASLKSTSRDAAGTTQICDLTATTELWYMVGNADAFKLYNKATGADYALNVNGTGDGAATTMVTASTATTWKLLTKNDGYAIVPSNATGMSINAYGGKGGDLKLYRADDQGGWWLFDAISESAFTLSVDIAGEPWEEGARVAELNMTLNDNASSTRITGCVAGKTYYLPTYATTFSLNSMTYRGYTFIGFEDAHGTITSSYTDAALTQDFSINALYRTNNERTLYYNYGTNGKPYRIPAIATAPNGHIFAIADNRPCGMDIGYGEVDIKCRISTDNGATWGEEFFVADGQGGNTNEMTTGFGDAAIVADCEQNKLLVMMVCGRTVCHNGRWDKSKIGNKTVDAVNRVARVYATYNEATKTWEWTQPEEVTDHIYSLFLNGETPTVTSLFIGSGKICQSRVVKKGEYYRLYCSMWTRDGGNRVIYSDDFGNTWNVLGTIADRPAPGGDEPKVEELPDGTVVLSSRKSGGRYFNLFTFKDNTYTTGTWGEAVSSNNVTNGLSFGGNSTNGEIYKVTATRKSDGTKCDIMFQSVPTGESRNNVAIFYKEMKYKADGTNEYTPTTFAQGWAKGIHVSTKGSCYSTMIMQADGRIGFLFEEHPGDNYSYCIVYIPYSIEELTGGLYSLDTEDAGIECPIVCPQAKQGSYDLTGRKLNRITEKGIYIVNGKKVIL